LRTLRIVLRLPFCRHSLSARSALFWREGFRPGRVAAPAGRISWTPVRKTPAVPGGYGCYRRKQPCENSPAKLALHTANSEPHQDHGYPGLADWRELAAIDQQTNDDA
jgi:hypothetical protein